MNKFTRDMLMAKYDGSKTVSNARYSSNDSERYSSNDRMIREPSGMPDDRFEHLERKRIEDMRRDREMHYTDRGNYRNDYNRDYNRDYNNDYNRGYDRNRADYNRDYNRDYERDYGETQYGKLSHKDLEMWKRNIQNQDGTRGEHFKKEQIEPLVRKLGIDVERMGGIDVFTMAVNMKYADYCEVAKRFGVNQPEYYVECAKAFFNDKDFYGEPEEKLWLYYKCIAEQE